MSVVRGVGGIDRRALAQRALPATVLGTVSAALLWVLWRFMTPPLWFDEQWRARRISMPQGFWHDLSHTAAGPSSVAWLAVERAVVAVLGDRELPLRLPLVAALPLLGLATYWLATRFVHRHVALVTAVLVTVNPPLLVYGLQLKPYVSEAAATATFVALWLAAQAAPPSWRRQLPYYTGMGALVLFGIPLLFLLPGLLGYQLGRSLRRSQGRGVRLGLATAVGVVGALHWLLFLRPQSRMLRSMSYWQPAYLPVHDGIEAALRFVLDRTVWHPRMLSSAGLLPPDVSYPGIGSLPLAHRLAAPVAVVADVAVTVALAIGVVWALRRRDLRPVPVAVGVALMAQLGISSHGLWPYGGNRTNLFLLPVLAVLVAAGMAATFRWAWGRPTRVVLAACLALGVATTLPIQAGRLYQLHRDGSGSGLFVGMRDLVGRVRATAGADDVVVLTDPNAGAVSDYAGWTYYMYQYDGWPSGSRRRPPVPRSRVMIMEGDSTSQLDAFLSGHPDARRVYLFELWSGGEEVFPQLVDVLAARGWCGISRTPVPHTGLLVSVERAAGCRSQVADGGDRSTAVRGAGR